MSSSPFGLSLQSQTKSFPPNLFTEVQVLASSWCVFWFWKCNELAKSSLLVSLCLSCLLQAGCCTLLWASKLRCLIWFPSHWRRLPGWGKEEPFPCTATSQGHRSHPDFFYFPIIPRSSMVIFLAALVAWHLLPAFSGYSVRTVPHVDVFLYICDRRWTPLPSILPSWSPQWLKWVWRWAFQKYLESE